MGVVGLSWEEKVGGREDGKECQEPRHQRIRPLAFSNPRTYRSRRLKFQTTI